MKPLLGPYLTASFIGSMFFRTKPKAIILHIVVHLGNSICFQNLNLIGYL